MKSGKSGMIGIKIVLDTNLFISILLRSPSLTVLANSIRSGKIRLIVSPPQIAELTAVLHRPKFNFPPGEIKELLDWINREAILATPPERPSKISRDPKDDFILAAATAGHASAIVTGDKDLLVLGSIEGIPIFSPSRFIAAFL